MKFVYSPPTVKDFSYPQNPPFGKIQTPLMLSAQISFSSPVPDQVEIGPTKPILLDPFCSTLHYGQSIFEGLKAYKTTDGRVGIYRAKEHIKRLVRSAQIMCMPDLDEEFLLDCLVEYVRVSKEYVPSEEGHSLYLRPLLFGNDNEIKVKVSESYLFLILSSIAGDYFATKGKGPTKVLISTKFARAFKGGTGEAKTAANYAQSLPGLRFANSRGYQQVIYLDANSREKIEELGGMNFFWVENNTKLCTPSLSGQILHGITRASILEIAKILKMEVEEKELTLNQLVEGTNSGKITEVFASGTAAIVSPLDEIGILDTSGNISSLQYKQFPTMQKIKDYLQRTQKGETELSEKYLYYV